MIAQVISTILSRSARHRWPRIGTLSRQAHQHPDRQGDQCGPGGDRHQVAGRPAEEEQPNASPQDQKEYDGLVKNVIAVSLAPAPRSPVHARA